MQIGLYFCLRSCKYTKTNSHRQTTQLRLRDIQFQDARKAIPFKSPASLFLTALVVDLFLNTQKNSFHGESIIMENNRMLLGRPVVACTRRYLHLHDNEADLGMPICVYFDRKGGVGKSVTSNHLVALLRLWVGNIGFARLGFHLHNIGFHYLRLGGAMTLHQPGQYDSSITVIGRWRSDVFLIYLEE